MGAVTEFSDCQTVWLVRSTRAAACDPPTIYVCAVSMYKKNPLVTTCHVRGKKDFMVVFFLKVPEEQAIPHMSRSQRRTPRDGGHMINANGNDEGSLGGMWRSLARHWALSQATFFV